MTLTRVAAFGRWRKRGYRVRAGEKGLRIFGPVTRPPDLTGRACHGRRVSHGWISQRLLIVALRLPRPPTQMQGLALPRHPCAWDS